MIHMSFGDRLRSLIEERGMTQRELAGAFNIAPSTLSCYVQDTREPDFSTLKALADYFDVSADYLLERQTRQTNALLEDELLRIFRTLTPEQQILYLEQGKAFSKINAREPEKSSPSDRNPGGRVG